MTTLTKSRLHAANRAIYLPAITPTFARFAYNGRFQRNLPLSAQDLNFLDPSSNLFSYPFALYSAGQDIQGASSNSPPNMVSERDRSSTIIVADSGGFQIQGDRIKFRGAETTRRMMRWMEKIADWSMILDFPTGGISLGNVKPHSDRLIREGHDLKALSTANGQSIDYNACLLQTKINNDIFVEEHALGATKFLNVLQGRNEAESKIWFDAVKGYKFPGWALAGGHQKSFSLVLARLLDMLDAGILQDLPWLHVLGVSTLEIGCLLTVLQRAVRAYINPDLQISFDSASPFVSAGKNLMIVGHTMDEGGWVAHSLNVAEAREVDLSQSVADFCARNVDQMDATFKGTPQPRSRRPCASRLDTMLTMGDIWAGSLGSSDIDADASPLLMHHNVEAMVTAHAEAHGTYFGDDPLPVPTRTNGIAASIDLIIKEYAASVCRGGPYPKIADWRHTLDRLAM